MLPNQLMVARFLATNVVSAPVFIGTVAHAFEVYGFRSGTTLEVVQERVRSRGEELVHSNGIYLARFRGSGVKGLQGSPYNMTFCEGRLYAFNQRIQGGFEAFTRIGSDLAKSLTLTDTLITSHHGPDGLLSTIQLSFAAGQNETQSVIMSQMREGAEKGESVYQMWSSLDVFAPCRSRAP